ncbi:hypothetical protein J6590_005321 [Homalodisca vitripennis]|nr:hypothetical protein J6590_005321 [Homalodisca vitripennis]
MFVQVTVRSGGDIKPGRGDKDMGHKPSVTLYQVQIELYRHGERSELVPRRFMYTTHSASNSPYATSRLHTPALYIPSRFVSKPVVQSLPGTECSYRIWSLVELTITNTDRRTAPVTHRTQPRGYTYTPALYIPSRFVSKPVVQSLPGTEYSYRIWSLVELTITNTDRRTAPVTHRT